MKDNIITIHKNKISKIKLNRLGRVGNNINIFGNVTLYYPENIFIGDNVNINDGVSINATNSKVFIGSNCTISSNVQIIAASYDVEAFLKGRDDARQHVFSKVVIGDNCWICSGTIICPDVKIADHVIIGAGSIVTDDIDERYCLAAGNKAIIIKKYRNDL